MTVVANCKQYLLDVVTLWFSVWNSWKLEQRYVRFHLRKAATTSFRHVPASSKALRGSSRSRPRKHLRKTRPNFVGATETFIDGPLSCVGGFAGGPPTTDHLTGHVCDGRELEGTMATSSSSGSTTGTFSSDLSAPTTNTSSEDGLDNNGKPNGAFYTTVFLMKSEVIRKQCVLKVFNKSSQNLDISRFLRKLLYLLQSSKTLLSGCVCICV